MVGNHFNGPRPGCAPDHEMRLALHRTRAEISRIEQQSENLGKSGEQWLLSLRRRERELNDSIS